MKGIKKSNGRTYMESITGVNDMLFPDIDIDWDNITDEEFQKLKVNDKVKVNFALLIPFLLDWGLTENKVEYVVDVMKKKVIGFKLESDMEGNLNSDERRAIIGDLQYITTPYISIKLGVPGSQEVYKEGELNCEDIPIYIVQTFMTSVALDEDAIPIQDEEAVAISYNVSTQVAIKEDIVATEEDLDLIKAFGNITE